eukprot:CAMPEP_0185847264 /NCGR_PEP_ID=MMETSP1354-20130828/2601_1 /TAXON_ID=708628 /ORGANISM="Erythrolobus madagascarensis, Strain CCMP3276" /LENGTH=340 /DNA_ID=CAMNT_0028547531 /DNA_START=198 /DNA_END=1220 /DNA_ORIENTATION=+
MEGSVDRATEMEAARKQSQILEDLKEADDIAESEDEEFFNDPDHVEYSRKESKLWFVIMGIGLVGWLLWAAFYIPFMIFLAKPGGLSADSWTYDGFATNPSFWQNITPSYDTCAPDVPFQSPININPAATTTAADSASFADLRSVAKHLTGDFRFEFEHNTPTYYCTKEDSCGSLKWLGQEYFLRHFSFHQRSQHSFNGVSLPLELSMVHATPRRQGDDVPKYAILTILYTENDIVNNTALNPLWWSVMQDPGGVISNVQINALYDQTSGFFVYTGSLMIPPCTPSVLYFVQNVFSFSSFDQNNFLRNKILKYPGNRRPLQSRVERQVLYYPAIPEVEEL